MPVSPQDYALWSDLTGNPYPQTPAERMALAPEVYSFTRDVNQGRRPPGAIRRAVDVIGVRQHLLLVQLRVVCILQKISALLNLMMSLILALLRNLRELCR